MTEKTLAQYAASKEVEQAYAALAADPRVQKALRMIEDDSDKTFAEQCVICKIAAPTFFEHKRTEYFRKRLLDIGLSEVTTDEAGNVHGLRPGAGGGPKLFLEGHLDTVFPEETDLTITEKNGIYYAPGISDDARGLAVVLEVAEVMNACGLKTVGDLVVGGTVGEEGTGDLKGMKAFFAANSDIDASLGVDGSFPGIKYLATGSHRYKVTFTGPGGHSFSAFGNPSATHAMARAIAKFADYKPPAFPKTTFTVGVVQGGTTVNSIAREASLLLDIRSNCPQTLLEAENHILPAFQMGADEENHCAGTATMTVRCDLIGDRPAVTQKPNLPLVQCAAQAHVMLGLPVELAPPDSTNANWPMHLGIPALNLGGGGKAGKNHSLDEWFDPKDAFVSPQKVLLTVLGALGLEGVTRPLVNKRR